MKPDVKENPDVNAQFAKDFLALQKRLQKEQVKLTRTIEHRKAILEEASNWKALHHEGLLLQANLFKVQRGMDRLEVVDWDLDANAPMRFIVLDPRLSPHEQIKWRFRKSTKLQAAIPHAERMLEKSEQALVLHLKKMEELESCKTLEALQLFSEKNHLPLKDQASLKPKVKEPAPKIPYKTFVSETGCTILAGKSAKDNDLLSFHHAKGSDWWMHAHNCSGSHVVIKTKDGEEPDAATLRDAAEVALRLSQLKQSGEVTLTQVKFLRRLKTPGKVMLSQHKVLNSYLDEKRWKRLTTL